MELQIKEISFPQVIEFNFDELKTEIQERVSEYKNLVYGDEEIKKAKEDRANLNKFVKAISDERIKIKKQCLKPYEEFEKKIEELTKIVQEPISVIDQQIKGYEEKVKEEKNEKIKAYFQELVDAGKVPEGISLIKIFNQKWLNASVSMKSIQEEMSSRMEQITADINTLESLPEFGFEAKSEYIRTLDINYAISEAKRMSDIAKAKAEAEARKAEYEATQAAKLAEQMAEKKFEEAMNPPVDPAVVSPKNWVSFKAYLTKEEAFELKQFFDSRAIEYGPIQGR